MSFSWSWGSRSWYIFLPLSEQQARAAWKRGKGRSRKATRRRVARREAMMTFRLVPMKRVVPGQFLPCYRATLS